MRARVGLADRKLRHGVQSFGLRETALDWVAVVGSDKGINRVMIGLPSQEAALERVHELYDAPLRDDEGFADVLWQIEQYASGSRVDFVARLDYGDATPFQRAVWEELRRVPYGRTVGYGELAERVSTPRGGRAVGNAMAANHLMLLVPCHRVIAADNSIGGYSGGLEWKRRLLALEGVELKVVERDA